MTPAEHHLGDRLAALVDGELGHDARERVLSHLATCWSCKAEADAQRQLKNVFADTAPPPPSDGLLARLQGLPAGGGADPAGRADDDDRGTGPGAPGDPESALRAAAGLPGGTGRSAFTFEYLPVGGREGGRGPLTPERGFRIHEVHRVDRDGRAALRGRRRFAFAAAGAFSLAALAIGGALTTGAAGGSTVAKGDGSSASPVRTAASGGSGATSRDNRRRTPESGQQRDLLSAGAPSTLAAGALRGGILPGGPGVSATAPPLLALPMGPLRAPSPLPPLPPRQQNPAAVDANWYTDPVPTSTLTSLTAPTTTLRAYPGRVVPAPAPAAAPTVTAAPPGR